VTLHRPRFAARIATHLALLAGLALFLSCDTTLEKREGPMIPSPPAGFAYDPNATAARLVYPDRAKLSQRAYATMGEPYSSIYITEFAGTSAREDAEAARRDLAKRYPAGTEYGALETLTIDGRAAWGWLETSTYQNRISSYEFKAIVPYDEITYSVEFDSNQPGRMGPDYLREVVGTFKVNRKGRFNPVQIIVLAGILVAGWFAWKHLERARFQRGPV